MKKNSITLGIIAVALGSMLTTNPASADSGAWTGNGSNDSWNNNSNWTAPFPGGGHTATFNATVSNSTVSMNGTAVSINNIGFNTSAGSYTFNAGGGSLTLSGAANALIVNANTAGNVTQTFNVAVGLASNTSTAAFTNNGTDVFLDLAGGVNSGTSSRIVSFTGTGRGGRVNGLTQGGGNTSITFGGSGAWEFTGTTNASGNLTISTTGGLLISGNLSSTARTTLSGRAMINNDLASGGLSASRLTQSGTLEAHGTDRTINTGNHTLDTNATFAGSNSITIGSLATIAGSTGSLTNNITGAGKSLVFNNANFYLADTDASRARVIGGTGTTEIQSNIANNAVGNTLGSGITKQGTGTLILSGSNSYSGDTIIEGGAVVFNSANAMAVGEIRLNGGVLGLGAGNFTRNFGTGNNNFRWTQSGGVGGGFAAYGADRSVNVGGAGANINWGTAQFILSGQTFMLGAADSTHTLTYVNPLGLGNATRTIQVADGTSSSNVDGEFSGALSGTGGGINKTGAGTLLLSANNTYTGETLVTAGTLIVNGHQTVATGAVSVAAGATLGGGGTLRGATTVRGVLSPGNGLGILNVVANTTWVGASLAGGATDWKFELGPDNTSDQLNITGNFLKDTAGGTAFRFDFLGSSQTGTFKLVDWSGTTDFDIGDFSYTGLADGNSGSFAFNGSQLEFQVVPEPSTWALLASSLLALLIFRGRGKTSTPARQSTRSREV
jgi:autotransporter-associated beta strand protein